MKCRFEAGRGARAAILAAATLVAVPSTVQAQAFPDVCKIRFDERRAANLLERTARSSR